MADTEVVFASTSSSIRIPFDKIGFVAGAASRIPLRMFTDQLRTFNLASGEPDGQFYWADYKRQVLHLPVYLKPGFIRLLESRGEKYKEVPLDPGEGAPVTIEMRDWFKPKDDRQARAIEFMTDPNTGPVRPVAMQTGGGKTAAAIKTASFLGRRTMVIAPLNLHQWREAIKEYTLCTDEDIFTLKGGSSVRHLVSDLEEINPKFILASTQTLQDMMKKDQTEASALGEDVPFNGLVQVFNVGTVVTDEVHLFFERNVELALRLNVAVSLPMTATFTNSDQKTKQILDCIYPPDKRFGEDEYKKYVNIIAVRYSFDKLLPKKFYHRQTGYNHNVLEKTLVYNKPKLLNAWYSYILIPILDRYYLKAHKPEDKCLLLCSSRNMCELMKKKLDKTLEEKELKIKTVVWVAGVPRAKLLEADLIIATAKSGGTGSDLPNLLTMINTVAVRSETENMQNLGRLRELKDGRNPFYVFLTWDDIPTQQVYLRARTKLYAPAGKTYHVLRITPQGNFSNLY